MCDDDKATDRSDLANKKHLNYVCDGMQRHLPAADVTSLLLDQTCMRLEKTFGRDVAAERLRERVARLEGKQD
jgi:hypothetical protein